MSYKHNIIKERFDIFISEANSVVKESFEIDRNATILVGVGVTSDNEEQIYFRGSQRMAINDQELFPEKFETKLLMTGLGVSPNDRMVKLGNVPTGNKRVEIWYQDEDHPNGRFSPYRISFYFYSKVEIEEGE